MTPGRNDPCHCGSGRKWKKCCMDSDEARRAKAEWLKRNTPKLNALRARAESELGMKLPTLEEDLALGQQRIREASSTTE